MSSISTTLNSITASLLSEISSASTNSTQKSAGSTATSSAASTGGTSDQASLSPIASLFKKLEALQTSNPTEFKQVLADGAKKLEAAAQQSTDPAQATFLNNLASKFQQASQSGNLLVFQSGSDASSTSPVSGHHHHHHGGDGDDQTSTSSAAVSTATTSSTSSTNSTSSTSSTGTAGSAATTSSTSSTSTASSTPISESSYLGAYLQQMELGTTSSSSSTGTSSTQNLLNSVLNSGQTNTGASEINTLLTDLFTGSSQQATA